MRPFCRCTIRRASATLFHGGKVIFEAHFAAHPIPVLKSMSSEISETVPDGASNIHELGEEVSDV
jgi:hypothetical protein